MIKIALSSGGCCIILALFQGQQNQVETFFDGLQSELSQVLLAVPREMMFVFKHRKILGCMQDVFESIDDSEILGDMARYSVQTVYMYKQSKCASAMCRLHRHIQLKYYMTVIMFYEWYVWFSNFVSKTSLWQRVRSHIDNKDQALKRTVRILGYSDNFNSSFTFS